MDKNGRDDRYWASVGVDEIAYRMGDKITKYYEYLQLSGRLDLYRRSWQYYFRPRLTGARMNPVGQQGELTAISVNHYRNLLLHLETMTCQQRAAFEPRATNSDVKSQSQVILAAGLLDYYMRDKKMERNIKAAVKDGLIYGEGFLRVHWNPTSGEVYGQTESGAAIYEGDVEYRNYIPVDVVRDFTQSKAPLLDWVILRDFENKYDLAAKFPGLRDDILNASVDLIELAETTTLNAMALDESDLVPVYTLIHKPTPSLPQGRYTRILNNDTVLQDGPLPYKETHVYRLAPDEESGTIFGFTVGFDLLAMQEAIDMLYSTAVTNQATFGVQNILAPKGHDVSVSQMSGGLNLIEYDYKLGEIKALNLTQTPPEIFNFMQMLEQLMETISGVNSVARGNPEASLKSGAALALVQSMAVQFSMNLQQSYAQLVEDVGTGTIKILQEFAAVPRVAVIAGKSNRPLMKEFSGQDLDRINRVMVDMGNPLTRTTAGKVNLAEQMMNFNLIDNPDQYLQVVTTGRLEPVIEGKQAELLLIKAENEGLSEGQPQVAIATDNHAQHIMEHKTVLASPEAREDPKLVQLVLNHIQEHLNLLRTTDPALLAMIKQQSLAPQGPAPTDGGTGEMLNPQQPVMQEAEMVNQPNMPNPPAGTDPRSQEVITQQAG